MRKISTGRQYFFPRILNWYSVGIYQPIGDGRQYEVKFRVRGLGLVDICTLCAEVSVG